MFKVTHLYTKKKRNMQESLASERFSKLKKDK